MEMINKGDFGRRCLLTVAIFIGMSIPTSHAAENQTEEKAETQVEENIPSSNEELNQNIDSESNIETKDATDSTSESTSKSDEPRGTGLHVSDAKNTVTQSNSISLSGESAVGIRVDGSENKVVVPSGTNINSTGAGGKGILVSYGRDHDINVAGNINAAGNAVEFNFESEGKYSYAADELNGALANNFNLSGKISGGERAIYIGKNAFVKNININSGAQIEGNIVSDWKHFSDDTTKIQYNGEIRNATDYVPDLVTNLNINADFSYGGNITGADNIKINVRNGTLKFTGTANVVNVEVMNGAKLYGGTFQVNNMGQESTGRLINHGTIAASSANTNLVINGDLVSDGVLQKVSGGSAGRIIVNGNANIEGSTVTTDSLLPNETETVLVANSISGKIKNPPGNPVPISAMLSATGEIIDNTLVVTTHEADNMRAMNSDESKTYDAMNNMYEKLEGHEQEEMREFYNLAPPEARRTLHEIGAKDSAQIMSVAQQNTAVDRMISDRIAKIFAPDMFSMPIEPLLTDNFSPDYVNINVHPLSFADGEDNAPEMKIKVKVPSKQENNFWINYMKNWGSMGGGTDYHGSAIIGGYDRPFGKKWRAGVFATYGTIGYGADSSRATVYDTRLGIYAGYHNKQSDVYFYINGGQLRNSLHRGISSLGLSTNANYKSHIVEIGGEYKYDLQPKKIWHVSPYVNMQVSYLKQNSYNESGAGIYNQHVRSNSNTYFAMQTGVDLKRYYKSGMFGFRLGVKRGFTGADPDLKISYEGDTTSSYRIRYERDKTHFICSLRGESEIARGWYMGGEAELQLGENDKDVTASLMIRRMW